MYISPQAINITALYLQVFQTFFWMQLHGGSSPKRTVFMGNVRSIDRLNKGKLTKSVRTKKTKIKTTRSLSRYSRYIHRALLPICSFLPAVFLKGVRGKVSTLTRAASVDLLVTRSSSRLLSRLAFEKMPQLKHVTQSHVHVWQQKPSSPMSLLFHIPTKGLSQRSG